MVRVACEEGIDAVISGAGIPLELPGILGGSGVMAAPIVSSAKGAKTIANFWLKRFGKKPDFIVAEGSLSLIHISEPTRQAEISYAVFCLKKKKKNRKKEKRKKNKKKIKKTIINKKKKKKYYKKI